MIFQCVSVNGFAGDRTPEAMIECHNFATAFSKHFDIPLELVGHPASARTLPWDAAIIESEQIFKAIIENLNRILSDNNRPILITPRCASAIASLPTIAARYTDVVVLYFDAHGDMNTPQTSKTGYLGGMPITAALGLWNSGYGAGLGLENIVHIGGRDFDPAEQLFIQENSVQTFTKDDLNGDLAVLHKTIAGKPVYIHLDTDVFDPEEVTAEYAVENGLYRHHVRKVVDLVLKHSQLVGIEITELSPRTTTERHQSYKAVFDSLCGLNS